MRHHAAAQPARHRRARLFFANHRLLFQAGRAQAAGLLATTCLFGGFDDAFYDACLEMRPLEPGWEERMPLYNLYHLLNHLDLFGSAWLARVRAVLVQYS